MAEDGGTVLQGGSGNPQVIGRNRPPFAPEVQVNPGIELGGIRFDRQQPDPRRVEERTKLTPVFGFPLARRETAQQLAQHHTALIPI